MYVDSVESYKHKKIYPLTINKHNWSNLEHFVTSSKIKFAFQESQEQELQERTNKLIDRYVPFLENCIKKLEKCEPTTKVKSHLTTLKKLIAMVNGGR